TSRAGSTLASFDQGAWSLPMVCTDPSASPAHSAATSAASRSGGAPTYAPASGPRSRSLVRCRYIGRASTYTGSPRDRPAWAADRASGEDRRLAATGDTVAL